MNRKADDEVFFAVELYVHCKTMQALPRAGGVLDQDWYHMELISASRRAFGILEQREMDAAKRK